jgi:hypothetical protein
LAYQKFDLHEQLLRFTRGESLDTSVEVLAELVLDEWIEVVVTQFGDGADFCARLFALPDTRTGPAELLAHGAVDA